MRKKVIITGANGFVGSLLCKELVEKGYYVIGLVRSHYDVSTSDVEYLKINELNDLGGHEEIFKGCYAVIHLAAKVHVKKAKNISEYRHINTDLTEYLANFFEKQGVKKFIYLSTIKVNGDITDIKAFDRSTVLSPSDAYAISKFEAEKLLMKIHAAKLMDVTVIRPVLMYGPNVKGNLHSLMKLVKKKLPLPFGGITNKRSLLHVRNLNSLIIECIENNNSAGQTFLAADGTDVSTTDIVLSISRAMKLNIKLFSVPASVFKFFASIIGKPGIYDRLYGNLQVDIVDTKTVLDWVPPYSFEEGINEMVECFENTSQRTS